MLFIFICSRISIYVSSFQSIFTAEGVFHRETAKVSLFHYSILYDSVLFQYSYAGCDNSGFPVVLHW